jgi:gluconolactonase
MYVFDMQPDGTASNQRVFAEMPLVNHSEKNGVPDGIKVDSAGRVYCTGPGGIWIWEPGGALVGVLTFPEVTTNIAWGDTDIRTIFVTGHTSVYSLRTTTPGIPLPVFA